MSLCRRVKWSSNVAVSQPFVRCYNEGMGEVDLMDRLLVRYRPCIRGKSGGGLYSQTSSTCLWLPHGESTAVYMVYNDMDHLSFRKDTLCPLN